MPSSSIYETVTISHKNMVLEIFPNHGGSIKSFTMGNTEILRSAPDTDGSIIETGSFPLVPIVNRIPNGEFEFEGKEINLDGNFMGLPDFIHGHGWQEKWSVLSATGNKAVIQYKHTPDKWPWSYTTEQVFELTDTGLRSELKIINTSQSNMPADLGFHPHFPTTSETRLQFNYDGYWKTNDKGHAIERVKGSYRKNFLEGDDFIDSVMTDQTHYNFFGTAKLTEAGRPTISITASDNCKNLHIFFPPNQGYAAIEPTTGRSVPFGLEPIEVKTLAPNEEYKIWMSIELS